VFGVDPDLSWRLPSEQRTVDRHGPVTGRPRLLETVTRQPVEMLVERVFPQRIEYDERYFHRLFTECLVMGL
jgi:hypothetical protein